ncbi:MAG: hda [Rickettsiaceae bacterium]|nr:hda [Rickettsiaceae bacterium]
MQLAFDFPFHEKYLAEDFVVSSCNHEAFQLIQNYRIGDENLPKIFAICAPKFGGKTYLANIWKKKTEAEFLDLKELENTNLVRVIRAKHFYIVEDVDQIKNQELLLQIFNLIAEKSSYLLLTSSIKLNQINIKIEDLNSRLKNIFQIEIDDPDDDLIKMLLIKNFSSRQVKVDTKVIDFLAKNLDRNFTALHDAIRMLEFFSAEKRSGVTVPLVKQIFGKKRMIDL